MVNALVSVWMAYSRTATGAPEWVSLASTTPRRYRRSAKLVVATLVGVLHMILLIGHHIKLRNDSWKLSLSGTRKPKDGDYAGSGDYQILLEPRPSGVIAHLQDDRPLEAAVEVVEQTNARRHRHVAIDAQFFQGGDGLHTVCTLISAGHCLRGMVAQ